MVTDTVNISPYSDICNTIKIDSRIWTFLNRFTSTTMTKNTVSKLKRTKEAKCSFKLPESAEVMLCSIHKSVKSKSSFPQCEHSKLKLCSPRSHSCCAPHRVESSRSRSRSKSPRNTNCNMKSKTAPEQNLAMLRSSAIFQNCRPNTYSSQVCVHPSLRSQYPVVLGSSYINVNKMNGYPYRTCSCISNRSNNDSKAVRASIKSHSTLEMSNYSTVPDITHHILRTDEVVTELKDEIEKVKSQLLQMSAHKVTNIINNTEDTIAQLKTENKMLKKELEHNRKNQHYSFKDVEKAKEIMNDYEKKVLLLHEQAIKSSKLMKQSKEKFCKCLKEKEALIKELQKNNRDLSVCAKNKDIEYDELSKAYEDLEESYCNSTRKFETHEKNNKEFCQCITELENQLQSSMHESEQYKDEIKELQKKISEVKCEMCQKLETKTKKQKEKYENRVKEFEEIQMKLKEDISTLASKLVDAEENKIALNRLEAKCKDLQTKVDEYEESAMRCRILEEDCTRQMSTIAENEQRFDKDRNEMRQLVDELTIVVKHNKETLLKLSNINKQQEALLESQSAILLEKEEQIKLAESRIEILRKNSLELETELDTLKRTMAGPCKKHDCLNLTKQLEEVKTALSVEKDNHLVKQKIIEDQSSTISGLQNQIKEKMTELNKAREETTAAEQEMLKINNDLIQKQKELELELKDKDVLLQKLRKLECQKTLLSKEMEDLQGLLQQYCESEQFNDEEREVIFNLQRQVEQQKKEWDMQKENLANQKEIAIRAAKFATQKLLDTVSDFQKQVDTQKKVQRMLTKMLHDKQEELKLIKSKIFSINSITSEMEVEIPLHEIFKSNGFELSEPTTTSSFFSSYSNGSGLAIKQNFEENKVLSSA